MTDMEVLVGNLRALAAFLEENRDLEPYFRYTDVTLNIFTKSDDPGSELAAFARRGARSPASVRKEAGDPWYSVSLWFGDQVHLDMNAYREEVCERVQVGTETVTRVEHDPKDVEAALRLLPEVEVTEEVPVYEWQCKPLLSHGDGVS